MAPVVIEDCGQLPADDPSLNTPVSIVDGGDPYEDWPQDEESGDTNKPEVALKIAKDVREIANGLFKKGDVTAALQKYQSTSHHISTS